MPRRSRLCEEGAGRHGLKPFRSCVLLKRVTLNAFVSACPCYECGSLVIVSPLRWLSCVETLRVLCVTLRSFRIDAEIRAPELA